ncbi:hypothetical protein ACIBG7_25125 [Nonomuraea sp. NPDC050328]|uniref:hypothetical protein n=1 Tax=Nonomuraea sp. NPDC050328 TaxID=3364361 RepID=UPI0037930C39
MLAPAPQDPPGPAWPTLDRPARVRHARHARPAPDFDDHDPGQNRAAGGLGRERSLGLELGLGTGPEPVGRSLERSGDRLLVPADEPTAEIPAIPAAPLPPRRQPVPPAVPLPVPEQATQAAAPVSIPQQATPAATSSSIHHHTTLPSVPQQTGDRLVRTPAVPQQGGARQQRSLTAELIVPDRLDRMHRIATRNIAEIRRLLGS